MVKNRRTARHREQDIWVVQNTRVIQARLARQRFAPTPLPAIPRSSGMTSMRPCRKQFAAAAPASVSSKVSRDMLGVGSAGTFTKRGTSTARPERTRAIGSTKRNIRATQNSDWIGAPASDPVLHGMAGRPWRKGHCSCPHMVPPCDRGRRALGDGSSSWSLRQSAPRRLLLGPSAMPVDRRKLVVSAE